MAGMELRAKRSRTARVHRKRSRVGSDALFREIIRRYSQMEEAVLDPSQLQVGQSLYGPEGDEFLVVENPEDTTTTVVMPADQGGAQVPQEVQTVEDVELTTSFSLQPATGLVAAVINAGYADEDNPSCADPPPPEMEQVRAPDFMEFGPQTTTPENWAPGTGDRGVPRYDPTTYTQETQTSGPETSGPLNPDTKPAPTKRPKRPHLMKGGALREDVSEMAP